MADEVIKRVASFLASAEDVSIEAEAGMVWKIEEKFCLSINASTSVRNRLNCISKYPFWV